MSSCYVPGRARQASTSGHSELAHESVALWSGLSPSILKLRKLRPMEESGFAYQPAAVYFRCKGTYVTYCWKVLTATKG